MNKKALTFLILIVVILMTILWFSTGAALAAMVWSG
jgi:hypothetical protein